jgi:hypothetical protein
VFSCVALGYLGAMPAEGIYVTLARIFTIYYFAFFIILMPLLGLIERTKPVPNSIAESVLDKDDGLPDPQEQTWIWGGNRPRSPRLPRLGGRATLPGGSGRPDAAPAAPRKD